MSIITSKENEEGGKIQIVIDTHNLLDSMDSKQFKLLKDGRKTNITEDRIRLLNEIGFAWSK